MGLQTTLTETLCTDPSDLQSERIPSRQKSFAAKIHAKIEELCASAMRAIHFSPLPCSDLGQGVAISTVRHRGMGTGISEASKRVPIFSFELFATQGGKQVSFHFRQRNWVQA